MNGFEVEIMVLIGWFALWVVSIVVAGLLGYWQYLDKKQLQKQLAEKRANVVQQVEAIEQVILRNKLTGDLNAKSIAIQVVSEMNGELLQVAGCRLQEPVT